MRNISLLITGLLSAHAAHANLGMIPEQSGFSGLIMGGVTTSTYQSNFYSGKGSKDRLDNPGAPQTQQETSPLLDTDLRYTFADSRTQLFMGNLVQDAIRYDFTQQLGIRQQLGDKGIIAGSFVFNNTPVKQWQDPFATGISRSTTQQKSRGVRIGWDNIWGSSLDASVTHRQIGLDEEHSGQQYDQIHGTHYAELLDRNGYENGVELSYLWTLPYNQFLEHSLHYQNDSLNGRAASFHSSGVQLTYGKRATKWSIISNVYVGKRNYAEANPIWGQQADAREVAISGTFLWHNWFDVPSLSAIVSASYSQADSDIDFYNSRQNNLSAGILYNF